MPNGYQFNPPPGWPTPPPEWEPATGWAPDPSWPPAPAGWVFWIAEPSPAPEPTPAITGETTGAPEPEPAATVEDPADGAEAIPPADGDAAQSSPAPADELGPALGPQHASASETAVEPELPSAPQATPQHADVTPSAAPASEDLAASLDQQLAERRRELAEAEAQLVQLNDALLLQQVGIYQYHHPLENAEAYRARLAALNERIRDMVRAGQAIRASDRFAYNNSLAQGRRMTADFSKLMLRAFNAEADACVRSLRAGTSEAALRRLDSAADSIAKLGRMMEMSVTEAYRTLRAEEITLTSDYLMKVQEEKEAAREERERLREERKVAAELAAERERLDKERGHYERTLATLLAQGKTEEAADVQARLEQIIGAIEQNDYRAANIRAGYVYVISNVGAFGPDVVKIGLTRRLEPMDRIRELGDASVPFPFDVHAIYFSDDAVTLENQLHSVFATRRVNQVNLRREYFFATPEQVRLQLAERVGNLLEFTEVPEATQYNMSRSLWPDRTSN